MPTSANSSPQANPAQQDCLLSGDLPHFPVFLTAPDLSPWLDGNTGISGFTTLDSGIAGPHVVLISLMHGNEIAGAIVLDELLRDDFKPLRGRVTVGFANLDAFARFDPLNPITSRFVEEDMNRVWDDAQIFGVRRSQELERAREIRPIIDAADIVLDLHSMLWPSDPLLLCGPALQGRRLAMAIGTPSTVIADQGHAGGKRLIDYGRFTEASSSAACILVEAGQHWELGTVRQMFKTVRTLLHHCGMIDLGPQPEMHPHFAEVTRVITAKTNRFVFTRSIRGGEVIAAQNTLIAHDGDTEIRTPHPNCLMVMPSLRPSRGHTAVRLARFHPTPVDQAASTSYQQYGLSAD